MDFPHFDITVDKEANANITLLKEILGLVKPDWSLEKVKLQDLSRHGFVNVNIICRHDDDAVFVRITNEATAVYNEELVQARKFVSKRGFSARLLCTFNNGFVEECLEGEAITWQTTHRVHDEEIKRGIAAEMARYHTKEVLEEAESVGIKPVVPLLRTKYLDYLWEDIEKCGKIEKSVLDSLPGKDAFTNEVNALNDRLDELQAEKAFCHFDTSPANIFVLKNGRVIFTDYETMCISYSAAEVGYYFLLVNFEFGKIPLETYPDEKYRRDFCREYLAEKRKIANDNSPIKDEELDNFERQVQVGMLLALLLFIDYSYAFLTNQFNTVLPVEQILAGIQALWPAYHAIKEAAFKENKV